MNSIQIGPEAIPIKPPGSPSLALAMVRLARLSPEWSGGASVVACCPQLAARAGIRLDLSDLAETGRRMYDWLLTRCIKHAGMGPSEAMAAVSEATGACFSAVMDGLPLEQEVTAEMGNSETTP